MENVLDFRSCRPPILPVVLPDGLKLHVTPPTVDLQDELQANVGELQKVLTSGDAESVATMYDLAARLMSCNRHGIRLTAVDLRDNHGLDLEDLMLFYSAYADFISGIKRAKN